MIIAIFLNQFACVATLALFIYLAVHFNMWQISLIGILAMILIPRPKIKTNEYELNNNFDDEDDKDE